MRQLSMLIYAAASVTRAILGLAFFVGWATQSYDEIWILEVSYCL